MSKFAIDEIFIDEAVNSSLLAVNSVGGGDNLNSYSNVNFVTSGTTFFVDLNVDVNIVYTNSGLSSLTLQCANGLYENQTITICSSGNNPSGYVLALTSPNILFNMSQQFVSVTLLWVVTDPIVPGAKWKQIGGNVVP